MFVDKGSVDKANMKKLRSIAAAFAAAGLTQVSQAADPIVQTKFTADPAPYVHDGMVYLYTTHDENDAKGFKMRDWLLYTSTDMVNWTDRGVMASLKSFKWADKAISGWGGFENGAWALQVIERDGKFYMYCPLQGRGIGVLVADNPYGPWTDPLDKPLITGKFDSIDPTVFIDDDGQAYLYWGNPNLWYVKLNKDMISFEGEPIKDASFAKVKDQPDPFHYQEGPWAYKRNGHYYMAYASTCCPEGIGYAMSDNPAGPWTFKGYLMKPDKRSNGNHPGIIDFKGKSYLFGFNYKLHFALVKDHRERRSVCVAEMTYNPDGTITELPWWEEAKSVEQIESLNPYKRVEAETIAWSEGMKVAPVSGGGMSVFPARDGAFIKVQGVDFGAKGAGTVSASVAGKTKPGSVSGGVIELRLDSKDGTLIGTLPLPYTNDQWTEVASPVSGATGLHDLFLIFKGDVTKAPMASGDAASGDTLEPLFKADYWVFTEKTDAPQLTAIEAAIGQYKIDSAAGPAHTAPVKVSAIFSDGTSKEVTASATITSENLSVASVANGIVTGAGQGETRLSINFDGKTASLPAIVKDLKTETAPKALSVSISEVSLLVGASQALTVTAEFHDGHTEDVTASAVFTAQPPGIASVKDGAIVALRKGATEIQASFTGKLGDPVTAPIKVVAAFRNPYEENRAEEFTAQHGVLTEPCSEGGRNVSNLENGDWISFAGLDFSSGAKTVVLRVASATEGGTIEVHLDGPNGPLVGSCAVTNTGGWQKWVPVTCDIRGVNDVRTICFKFTGGKGFLLNVSKWRFTE